MTNLCAVQDDITKLKVEAIVNAANTSLLGGGGVDGAVHRAAGPGLLSACRKLNGCNTGDAKITLGYELPAKFVIHAVGPVWRGGRSREKELLKGCYVKSLELCLENEIKSIAFPCISTGIYRFPKEQAAEIAVATVRSFLEGPGPVEKVVFCCFSKEDLAIYQKLL